MNRPNNIIRESVGELYMADELFGNTDAVHWLTCRTGGYGTPCYLSIILGNQDLSLPFNFRLSTSWGYLK